MIFLVGVYDGILLCSLIFLIEIPNFILLFLFLGSPIFQILKYRNFIFIEFHFHIFMEFHFHDQFDLPDFPVSAGNCFKPLTTTTLFFMFLYKCIFVYLEISTPHTTKHNGK